MSETRALQVIVKLLECLPVCDAEDCHEAATMAYGRERYCDSHAVSNCSTLTQAPAVRAALELLKEAGQ